MLKKRQSIYYEDQKGKRYLVTDELAKNIFDIEWIEIFENYDTSEFPALLIKKVNDIVGFGVFALENIKEGEKICFHTGRYKLLEELTVSHFDAKAHEEHDNEKWMVSSLNAGNVGRFINGSPTEDQLKNGLIKHKNPCPEKIIATSNAAIKFVNSSSRYKQPLIVATKNIKANEYISLPYIESLRHNAALPMIIKKNNRAPLPKSDYVLGEKLHKFNNI